MTPREQILATAVRLFFSQGYAQTGINQLIDESAVAKRTFYHHFASKQDLGAAYLDFASGEWLQGLRKSVQGRRSAAGVVRGLFEYVERFARDTQFRGCGILNMAAEFADADHALRDRVQHHKDGQRGLLRELFGAVGVPATQADAAHVLLEGAIAAAAAHRDVWPIRSAAAAAESLVVASAKPSSRGERA